MNIYVGVVHGWHDEVSVAATSLATAKKALTDAIRIETVTDFYFWKSTTVNKKRAYKLLCHDTGLQTYGKGCYSTNKVLGWIIITELIGAQS